MTKLRGQGSGKQEILTKLDEYLKQNCQDLGLLKILTILEDEENETQ